MDIELTVMPMSDDFKAECKRGDEYAQKVLDAMIVIHNEDLPLDGKRVDAIIAMMKDTGMWDSLTHAVLVSLGIFKR